MSILCIFGAFITGISEKVLVTSLQETENKAATDQIKKLEEQLSVSSQDILQLRKANKKQTRLLLSLENANITSRIQIENNYADLVKGNGWVDTINAKFKVLFMVDLITHANVSHSLQMAYDVKGYYYKVSAVGAQGIEEYMPNENTILRFKTKEFWEGVNKEINLAANIAKLDVKKINFIYWLCGNISYTSKAGVESYKKMLLGNQNSRKSWEIKNSGAPDYCERKTKKSDRGLLTMNLLAYEILKFFKPSNNYDMKRALILPH